MTNRKKDRTSFLKIHRGCVTASDTNVFCTTMNTAASEAHEVLVKMHLGWSDKQRRILTANGNAERFYSQDRGFAFAETELPHYHLLKNGAMSTHAIFQQWITEDAAHNLPIVGAWTRRLFFGGWEHSTDLDEHTFNLQTKTLFIDLRIPCTRSLLFTNDTAIQSLNDLSALQLALYARQHVFAGYSRLDLTAKAHNRTKTSAQFDHCCVRHHCIDWNFVGTPRSRPNKWWIEMNANDENIWKEWAFATDDHGQNYYCERWERLESGKLPILAMRKTSGRDGILIVIGDHFVYCLDREVTQPQFKAHAEGASSLVSLVDAALRTGDLDTARAWLSIQGGHGRVSQGWLLDRCIEFWKEGSALWTEADVAVRGESMQDCTVLWNGEPWLVVECSMSSADEVRQLLLVNARV